MWCCGVPARGFHLINNINQKIGISWNIKMSNRNLLQSFPKQIQFALIPLKLCSCVDKDLRLPHNDAMIFRTRHNNLQALLLAMGVQCCILASKRPCHQVPSIHKRHLVLCTNGWNYCWSYQWLQPWHENQCQYQFGTKDNRFLSPGFSEATTCSMTRKDLHDFASRRLRNARI